MKDAVLSVAKETIPKKKKKKQPWISSATLDLADKRQEARKRGDLTEWRKQHKEVSKAMRADQTAFVENKCMEMEKAGNNSKKVYSLVKELTQKSSARSDVINDKSMVPYLLRALTSKQDGWNTAASFTSRRMQKSPLSQTQMT